jgi:hypothetical protein
LRRLVGAAALEGERLEHRQVPERLVHVVVGDVQAGEISLVAARVDRERGEAVRVVEVADPVQIAGSFTYVGVRLPFGPGVAETAVITLPVPSLKKRGKGSYQACRGT